MSKSVKKIMRGITKRGSVLKLEIKKLLTKNGNPEFYILQARISIVHMDKHLKLLAHDLRKIEESIK